jgi:hypothetical protein
MQAQLAELVDALVSNTCGKPCRFDSGAGYKAFLRNQKGFVVYYLSYVYNSVDNVNTSALSEGRWPVRI